MIYPSDKIHNVNHDDNNFLFLKNSRHELESTLNKPEYLNDMKTLITLLLAVSCISCMRNSADQALETACKVNAYDDGISEVQIAAHVQSCVEGMLLHGAALASSEN